MSSENITVCIRKSLTCKASGPRNCDLLDTAFCMPSAKDPVRGPESTIINNYVCAAPHVAAHTISTQMSAIDMAASR